MASTKLMMLLFFFGSGREVQNEPRVDIVEHIQPQISLENYDFVNHHYWIKVRWVNEGGAVGTLHTPSITKMVGIFGQTEFSR